MSLAKYKQKRTFSKTPEPEGKLKPAAKKKSAGKSAVRSGKALRFVVQKHHATQLHYDFRLELDGVLKSWAVPKGPSMNPEEKHLAMMVEDHPYDYRNFEGVIPEGNYGAGKVIVWDEGTYEALGPIDEGMTEQEFLQSRLDAGDLKVVLHGTKLQGEFVLFRFKRAGDNAWILMKHKDAFASKKDILKQNTSVKSGLDVEEVGEKAPEKKPGKLPGKKTEKSKKKDDHLEEELGRKSRMPHDISPMLAELSDKPFDDKHWLYEIKWDGYRCIAEVDKGAVKLYSRNGTDFTKKFAVITEALKGLEHTVVLDGELVVVDKMGKTSFQLLQDYSKTKAGHLAYYIFDILYLDGRDIRDEILMDRKKILQKVIHQTDLIRHSDYIEEHGVKLFKLVQKKGMEGIIAKKMASTYAEKRTSDWLKVKHVLMQEAVICGFTEPKGKREEFGALVLGLHENGELRYVGHTGGGFDGPKLKSVMKQLKPLIVKKSPFPHAPKTNAPVTWVKPELVCQVKFSEWTNDGIMRQPIYLGMREDKKAIEVKDEVKTKSPAHVKKSDSKNTSGKAELTHLNKVFWPKEGYTKGDLLVYYHHIADYILPYLKDRPISMNRFPNGINGESFFQKDLINKPDWVRTVPMFSDSDNHDIHWLLCNDLQSLLYAANLGNIELNPWNARYQKPKHPDYAIIDLDPEGIPFAEVIRTAKVVKKLLDKADIDAFLKTSGKTGLHILIPLGAKYTFDQSRQFAEIIANRVFKELPDITSVVRNPKKREHKIYVDFLQNREGQTLAAPYCVRPAPGATVSTPLKWTELTTSLDPKDYTIKTIFKRLAKVGDIWAPLRKHKGVNMLKSLGKLV